MYNWLADPHFMAAYRAARRSQFDDGLAVLERNFAGSCQALVDVVNDLEEDTPARIVAAKAVIEHAFKAQDSIAVQEELAALGAVIDALKAGQPAAPAPVAEKPAEIRKSIALEHEQAEADLLRVAWMCELGNSGADIADSLRYNRPQSVADEQHLLDLVRQLVEVDNAYREATEPKPEP